jgi:hypothetical protein
MPLEKPTWGKPVQGDVLFELLEKISEFTATFTTTFKHSTYLTVQQDILLEN